MTKRSRKHILYVLNSAAGGASIGTYEMVKKLPQDRFLPFAVAPPGSADQMDQLQSMFADVRFIPMPWWNVNRHLGPLRRASIGLGRMRHHATTKTATNDVAEAALDWDIDMIHSGASVVRSGALAASKVDVPHVWHIKEAIGSSNRVHFPLSDDELVAYISGLSSEVVVMSEYIGDIFKKHHCPNLSILADGVDTTPYLNGTARNLRSRLGVADHEILVGMVASLSSVWKNHDIFIRMVSRLIQSRDMKFVLVGPKPKNNRWPHDFSHKYYQGLLSLISEMQLRDKLFVVDFVPDAPDIMRSLDILVHTCHGEPFGRIAIEAMAAGIPVVGPTTGGISETVQHGKTGILVTPADVNGFADATKRLASDRSLREEFGIAGRKSVRGAYTIEAHVDKQMDVYDKVLRT